MPTVHCTHMSSVQSLSITSKSQPYGLSTWGKVDTYLIWKFTTRSVWCRCDTGSIVTTNTLMMLLFDVDGYNDNCVSFKPMSVFPMRLFESCGPL